MQASIPTTENQYVEFKSEGAKAADLADEIVAFANSEGGEIWLGIEDDGSVSGLSRSYYEDVTNICRTSCIPPIQPLYDEFEIDGQRVARVTIVSGKDKPYYTSRNRYYIRVGSTKRVASREELVRLFQSSGAVHYDTVEIDRATVRDLDLGRIGDYFTRYNISFFDESESERLRLMTHADLLGENGKPTLAGLLVFGLSPERLLPQSGISFAHFGGTEADSDLLDKQNIGGPLPRQVDGGLATLKTNLRTPSTIEGALRVEFPAYPDRVYRELLVNACVHRNYTIYGSNIRVFLFDDRLEVISPGRLPNTVTIEKLPVGASFARNPVLMRLMENLGYVDKLGRGLPMVWQEARKQGLQVQFIESGEEFKVILPLPMNDKVTG
ncbi:MAG: putative DNA binding domain-containing protein [Caldilineaceae bacterium]